jgi:hypothetical protein
MWLGRPSAAMDPIAPERGEEIRAGRPVRATDATLEGLVEPAPAARWNVKRPSASIRSSAATRAAATSAS